QAVIYYDKGSSHYTLTQNLFRQVGVVPNVAMELDSMEASKKMVEEGLGIALLPRDSVEREVKLGILCEVSIKDVGALQRPVSLIYRRNRKRPRVVLALMDVLVDM